LGWTYFKKEEWINTLEQLQELYKNNPDKMIEYAQRLHQGIESISIVQKPETTNKLDQNLIKPLVEKWKKVLI